jgi:hypothetical protein
MANEDELNSIQEAISALASKGWPLNKRETYLALNLMGLTSRLQPSAATNPADQQRLVELAAKMADLAVAENERAQK